jgi:hypothetical protein
LVPALPLVPAPPVEPVWLGPQAAKTKANDSAANERFNLFMGLILPAVVAP